MFKIAPSILAADFSRLGEQIKLAESKGADMIHLDIMDGHFVPNISFGAGISRASKSISNLPHDAHLMVTDPENYIDELASFGIEYIVFHVEIDGQKIDLGNSRWVYQIEKITNENRLRSLIDKIKSTGARAGLALNPTTKLNIIQPLLEEIDLLLLMSVNPGFAGQQFMSEVYDKLKTAVEFRNENNLCFEIMIDGGVSRNNTEKLVSIGADILVSGSSFFKSIDFQTFIQQLKS